MDTPRPGRYREMTVFSSRKVSLDILAKKGAHPLLNYGPKKYQNPACPPPVFYEVPGPAGRAITSDSKAVVPLQNRRASAEVSGQPFDPAFFCGKGLDGPGTILSPRGFLIHRPPRRAILVGENWGWARRFQEGRKRGDLLFPLNTSEYLTCSREFSAWESWGYPLFSFRSVSFSSPHSSILSKTR